jgi:predicted nucleic acid-binding protein
MLLVDTNILIDVLADEQAWADWSIRQLRAQSQLHDLAINPVIYSELSLMYDSMEALNGVMHEMRLKYLELPREALFLAGKAFVKYKREGGVKHNVLPDFYVGAHAAVAQCSILTRDAARYKTYFPTVRLVMPSAEDATRGR